MRSTPGLLRGWLAAALFAAFVALGLSCVGAGEGHPRDAAEGPLPEVEPSARIRAVTLDARRVPPAGTLARLAALGASHIAVVPFAFQASITSPELRFRPDADWFSESETGIRALAVEGGSLGLGLIIKPHIWLGRDNPEGTTRADIGFETDAEWRAWEGRYRDFMLHYARLAEDVGAAMLVVGTELRRSAHERPGFWRQLAADVRAVYGGEVAYAANWWGEYDTVEFWDAYDYVGVQAYFPISEVENPDLERLEAGWEGHRAALRAVARRANRPVLFTEIGYRSVHHAAAEPWRWPSREEYGALTPDEALQARLYEAFFTSVWSEPWFGGAILWKWYPDDGRGGFDRQGRDRRSLDFTPQDKLAEDVIGRWFGAAEAGGAERSR